MNVLHEISIFINKINYIDLSYEVIHAVKRAFIDTMGVSLIGTKEKVSKLITEFVKNNNNIQHSVVIGGGFKTSKIDSALANGTILHALDYDDTGAFTQGHPSAPIFPVIIAFAEEYKLSGKDIIEAYVIGIEVFSRLSRAMPMLHLKGWHPTSILGTVVSAATASKLLKLSVDETTIALSLAGTQAFGMIKSFGTMAKPFHVGKATSNGIMSALLAQLGFTASDDFFNGELNFANTIFASKNHKIDEIPILIGKPLSIVSPGINIKNYPSCSLTHRAIDATLFILKNHQFAINDIDIIICHTPPRAKKVLVYNRPKTGLEAKFSMPFVIACAVKYQEVGIKYFTDLVQIILKNGQSFEKKVDFPIGTSKNPLSDADLIKKYTDCASEVLSKEATQELLNLILNLETLENINSIIKIIKC